MKLVKYGVLVVVGLVVLVAAVAAAGVYYVQNTDLRGWVAWAAKKNGVQVEMGGPVRVKLLPELVVSVEKFSLGAFQGTGTLASVDEASARVAWGGGLTPWKGFVVKEVEAKNPTVNLVRGKDGTANWELPSSGESKEEQTEPALETPSTGGLNLPMLAATKLSVTNLNATFDDQTAAQKVDVKGMEIQANTEGSVATTRMQGTVNGQAVSGNLRVDMGNFENIPVSAKLNGAGLALAVQGRVAQQKEFAGQVNVKTGNLRSTLGALLGKAPAQAPADAFQLTGDVTAGAERVVLRNFITSLGELLKATGDVDVTLGSKPAAKGQIKIQGSNLRQLAELGSGAPQPALPASPFSLSTELAGQNEIALKKLSFSLGNLATVNGEVKVVPQPLAVDANLGLTASSVRALAQAFGQKGTFPALPLTARVVLSGKGENYTIQSFDAALDSLAKASGNAQITLAAQPEVSGKFSLEGDNVQSAAKAFGVAAANIPASPFKAGASISGKGTITVDDLSINLPQLLQATGKLAFTPGNPANLTGKVDVSKLDATALGFCGQAAQANTSAPTASGTASPAGKSPWTTDPINLDALQNFATDVTIGIKGLTCASFPATAATAHIVNTPSQLDVKDVEITLPQNGNIKLNATLRHAGTPALTLNLNALDVAVEELVPTLKAKGIQLPVAVKAGLSSSGASTQALASNLAGTLEMMADKGRAPYGNLMGNLGNLQSLLKGQATVASNGSGLIDGFKAVYAIKDGVATAQTFNLSTDNGSMVLTSQGTVDIGGWTINTTLTPTAKTGSESTIAVPVLVKGPLSAPSIGADPAFVSKLTGRLATQGLKGALGKAGAEGVGGVVGDVLSGKGLTSEGVGNLINSFGNKKKASSTETSSTETPPAPKQQFQNLLNGVLNQ